MSPDALSVAIRYTIVTVVLIAALIFTNTVVIRPSAPTPAVAAPATTPAEPAVKPPSEAELFVQHEGKSRVACEPMCRVEEMCGLRDKQACMQASCDGAVRKLSTSDFEAARAGDCKKLAALMCKESCWRKGECAADHKDDNACTDACFSRAAQLPGDAYREQRCVLESACADAATCGQTAPAAAPAPAPPAGPPKPLLSLCAAKDEACTTYLPIWRELLMKRSGIDAAYFDAHVVPLTAKSEKWNDGRSLRVRYRLSLDWVSLEREDAFITFVEPSAAPYPALGVPRGVALDAEQIARAVAGQGWASNIAVIQRVDALKFRSQDDALAALRAHPNGSALDAAEISFDRPGVLPRQNGHPHLHAHGTVDLAGNRCSKGMIDLVTGEANAWLDACMMTGGRGVVGPRPTGGVAP